MESFSFHLAEKTLNVEINLPDKLPAAVMMPAQMKRVLSNLLQNAIQYSPVEGKIILAAEEKGPFIRISVTDEGEGIEAEETSRIFERFYRIDKSRSKSNGGPGLALPSLNRLWNSMVARSGFRVQKEKEAASGSRFRSTSVVNLD